MLEPTCTDGFFRLQVARCTVGPNSRFVCNLKADKKWYSETCASFALWVSANTSNTQTFYAPEACVWGGKQPKLPPRHATMSTQHMTPSPISARILRSKHSIRCVRHRPHTFG